MSEMSPVEAIFFAALERLTPAEQAAYLDEACTDNPVLRARVEKLLAAHQSVGAFLEPAPAEEVTGPHLANGRAAEVSAAVAGTIVAGKYKLLQQIGEGGMGCVWMADQIEPVKRRVAVKLIRVERGSSKTILSRFEAERQAIALMDHPHIAKLLDAGTTDAGRPYFVMELVKGIPLTEYCDAHRLSIADRLKLFMQICSAVQHAHQKGIIHRDLKPTNILVESHDDKAVPKVIDFGLAKKATSGMQLTEHTLFTAFGNVMGTPLYMAPEQAQFNAVDVDTRADVYALGVILYELLTGTTPLMRETIKKAALDEMLKLIREQEAPTPSSRLSSNEAKPTVAANRQMEPAKLGRFVKGELDWIVMKCLEKDRGRRYETANGLSMDIQRYLADEPVAAGPPSATYRLRKFVKKHRGPVIAGLTVMLLLVLGIAGTSWGLVEARSQRDVAEEARKAEAKRAESERRAKVDAQAARDQAEEARKAEAKRAESERRAKEDAQAARDNEARERGFAEAIAAFVKDDLLALTSVEGQSRFGGEELTRNATLRELLDRAADKLKDRKNLAPRTEAELNWIIGVSYRAIGEYIRAIPFLERSVELNRQVFGSKAQATLNAQNSLGVAYKSAGQYHRALPLFKDTIELMKTKLGPDHPDTLSTMANLALLYLAAGKLDLALPLADETFQLAKTKLGTDHPDTLLAMYSLASAYRATGKLDLSLPLFEETLKLMKANLPPDHPETLTTMDELAGAYLATGERELALSLLKETLKRKKAKFGPDHPNTLTTMNNLAGAYQAAGKLDLSLPLFKETLKLRRAKLGPDHPGTLTTMSNLALAYGDAQQLDLALPLFDQTLKLQRAKLGPDHPATLTSSNNLARAYRQQKQLDKSIPLFEDTLKLCVARLGADHPDTLITMNNLAVAYHDAKKLDLALPLFEETLKLQKAKLGSKHPATLSTMHSLACAYQAGGKLDLALPLFEETLKVQKAKLGADHAETHRAMNNLAFAYWQGKRLDKSIPLFEETLKCHGAKFGREYPETLMIVANLGVNYKDAGRFAEAIPLLEEAYRAANKYPNLRAFEPQLIDAYTKAGEYAKLANLLREQLPDTRKTLPKDSPQLAGLLAQIGMAFLEQNKWAEAEPLLRECLAIREKTQADSWTTFNTNSMLGAALLGQKKYTDAEPLLLAGYEGMKKREKSIPPQGSIRIREAIDRLVQLYEATSKKDDAAKWRSELAKYPEVAPMPREKK